jgi:uncharacterized protein (DUF1810 family)
MGLARFTAAPQSTYADALAEVRSGRKLSHWMWFVYPQHVALGRSTTAKFFGIADLAEARDYLDHDVLGPRLRECARAAADLPAGQIEACFGPVDTIKLRSSMTLFEAADPDESVFKEVLDKHFAGRRDQATLDLLAQG